MNLPNVPGDYFGLGGRVADYFGMQDDLKVFGFPSGRDLAQDDAELVLIGEEAAACLGDELL